MKSTLAKTKLKETLDALQKQVKATEVEIERIDNDIIRMCEYRDNLDAEVKVIIGDILGLQAILGEEKTEDVSVKDVERENVPTENKPTVTVEENAKKSVRRLEEYCDNYKKTSVVLAHMLVHIRDYAEGKIIDPVEITECIFSTYYTQSKSKLFSEVAGQLWELCNKGIIQKSHIGPNKFSRRRVTNYILAGAPRVCDIPVGAYLPYSKDAIYNIVDKTSDKLGGPVGVEDVANRLFKSDVKSVRHYLEELCKESRLVRGRINGRIRYDIPKPKDDPAHDYRDEELPF